MEQLAQLKELHKIAVQKHGEYIAADLALENETKATVTPSAEILSDMQNKHAAWLQVDNEFIELLELVVKS